MNEQKFFICEHCGNIVGLIHNAGVPLVCCGEKMKQLEPNTTDAATEKHVPVVEKNGNQIRVIVGSTMHPMSEEHQIDWVYLQLKNGGQRKSFAATDEPAAVFALAEGDEPVAVYAYCNLHGLWKADL